MMDDRYARLEGILRCPLTAQGLRLAPQAEIERLNARLAAGGLFHRNGEPVQAALQAGYCCEDGRYLYPVIEGVIILLSSLAIPLVAEAVDQIRSEKKQVQDFYDQIGWQRAGEDQGSLWMTLASLDRRIWKELRRLAWQVAHLLVLLARKLGLKETPPESAPQTPYVYFHRYGYFARALKDCNLRLAVWRSVHTAWTRAHIHPPAGEKRLRRIYQFEERHPVLAGRLGQYPLFIIEKQKQP